MKCTMFLCAVALFATPTMGDTVLKRFDFSSMDKVRADFDILNWNPGVVNHEKQYYVDSPDAIYTQDNTLVIRAHQEAGKFRSARIETKQTYSPLNVGNKKIRVEWTARVPAYEGAWPALWMNGISSTYGGWPTCGEIDVMEWVWCIKDYTQSSLHWKGPSDWGLPETIFHGLDDIRNWHTYRVDVCAQPNNEYLQFSVDDHWYPWIKPSLWRSTWHGCDNNNNNYTGTPRCSGLAPFDNQMKIIMNLAVGGDWGGACGVNNYDAFNGDGVKMEVKNVIVWELS